MCVQRELIFFVFKPSIFVIDKEDIRMSTFFEPIILTYQTRIKREREKNQR